MAYLNELVEKSFECSHAYVYVHTHTKNSAAFKSNMQAMRMHSPYSHYKTDMHRTEIGMHRPFRTPHSRRVRECGVRTASVVRNLAHLPNQQYIAPDHYRADMYI
jgi:hypothetical protein